MSEWIRITSDEKPIDGAYIITRLSYKAMYDLELPKLSFRPMLCIYGANKFMHLGSFEDVTDMIDAWAYLPNKFKDE